MKTKIPFSASLALLAGSSLAVLIGGAIAPALPVLEAQFQGVEHHHFWISQLLTLPALFLAIGAPIAGHLMDTMGRKKILLYSLFFFGLFGTVGFFLEDLLIINASRAFMGLAAGGVMAACTTLIGDYFEGKQLHHFIGLQTMAMAAGSMSFMILGGSLADLKWNYPFLLYLLGFLLLWPTATGVTEPKKHHVEDHSPFRHKPFILNYCLSFLGITILYLIFLRLPFHIKALTGASAGVTGLTLSVLTFTSAVCAFGYGRLKSHLSFEQITAGIFLFASVGFMLLYLAEGFILIIAGLVFTGIGMAFLVPNLTAALIHKASTKQRGRAIGFQTSAFFLGQFASPFLFYPLDAFTLAEGYLIAATGLLVLSMLFFLPMLKEKI